MTTARVTDASPAGLYAHSPERFLKNDQDVRNHGCDPEKNPDIASQLVYGTVGKDLNVILGGG